VEDPEAPDLNVARAVRLERLLGLAEQTWFRRGGGGGSVGLVGRRGRGEDRVDSRRVG